MSCLDTAESLKLKISPLPPLWISKCQVKKLKFDANKTDRRPATAKTVGLGQPATITFISLIGSIVLHFFFEFPNVYSIIECSTNITRSSPSKL